MYLIYDDDVVMHVAGGFISGPMTPKIEQFRQLLHHTKVYKIKLNYNGGPRKAVMYIHAKVTHEVT
jgi:hypothetical protein